MGRPQERHFNFMIGTLSGTLNTHASFIYIIPGGMGVLDNKVNHPVKGHWQSFEACVNL